MRNTPLLLLAFAALGQRRLPPPQKIPVQPIAYSHRQHIALGLQCKDCHTNPDPGDFMGLPQVSKCMSCHKSMKTDSPEIQKLAEFAANNRQPPWVRIYRIPDYVFFSHRAHMAAGAGCETCHGPVRERDQLWREVGISMGDCMDCHRANKASLDCSYCHDSRN